MFESFALLSQTNTVELFAQKITFDKSMTKPKFLHIALSQIDPNRPFISSHLSSLIGPTHTRPPCRGEGLLQERWRISNPVPQVVLHCPHDDHGVHPPFL